MTHERGEVPSDQVREFLTAHGVRTQDGRWVLPGMQQAGQQPLFERAALDVAEICLLLRVPLGPVASLPSVLALARRLNDLESRMYALEQRVPVPYHVHVN